jgi:hypothetical protein
MKITINITLRKTNLWHEADIFQLIEDTQNVSLGHEVGNLRVCIYAKFGLLDKGTTSLTHPLIVFKKYVQCQMHLLEEGGED